MYNGAEQKMEISRASQCARIIALGALAITIIAGANLRIYAQSWKLFAEKIKQEANEKANAQRIAAPEDVEFQGGTPGNSGRLLDFSNALGDDALKVEPQDESTSFAAQEGAPAQEQASPQPQEEESSQPQAPQLLSGYAPSYRAFPEMRAAARLNDVSFSSPNHGCAVGDRGTIFITNNGGKDWRLVDAPTDANLYAVSFLDDQLGIACGGRVIPTARSGRGALLRTVDGGATWTELPLASYPILRDARIISRDCAWLAGDASNLYPSGLFTSENDALDWTPVQGDRTLGWRAALYDPIELLGLGITLEGAAQRVEGDQSTRAESALGGRRGYAVSYDGATGAAWLVGEDGLVLSSTDFGATWRSHGGALPNGAQNYFDLYGVVSRDGFVGVFGSPGAQFFRSEDGGSTWTSSSTGVSTPLRSACFIDGSFGWAVGDFGTIIATTDGGRTWRAQRRGGERAAILGLFGRIEDAPLEAFVQLAGDESFLTEVALLTREADQEGLSDETPIVERFQEAIVETGGHGVVQERRFILNPSCQADSSDAIVARFNAENDGLGLARFRERMVRLIRIWRPDVVLVADSSLDASSTIATTNLPLDSQRGMTQLVAALAANGQGSDAAGHDPLRKLILSELPRALRDAADPTVYPEHISICRLEPYQTPKARVVCRGKKQGNLSIGAEYFCPTLGRSVGEISDYARKLTYLPGFERAVDSTSFDTLYAPSSSSSADATFFAGLEIPYGSVSRRARQSGVLSSIDALSSRASERRRNLSVLRAVIDRMGGNERLASATLGQTRGLISGRDVDFGLEYLVESGRLFTNSGAYVSAETALTQTPVENYQEPRAREGLATLLQFYCGGEPSLAALSERNMSSGQALGARYTFNDAGGGERLVKGERLAELIRAYAPDVFMSPELRFPYATTQLKRGDAQSAMRFYLNRSLISSDDLWGARAATEYWLRAPVGDPRGPGAIPCPTLVLSCRGAPGRPYLDGELEDAVWSAAASVPLSIPYDVELTERQKRNRALSTNLGATAAFLYDAEYLYIGVTCPISTMNAGKSDARPAEDAPRERDGDVTDLDRVELMLDVDGDYTTAYQFTVARDGRLNDTLWRDKSWNPKAYLATKEDGAQWTLEFAVPLDSLAEERPRPGSIWRVAIRRVAPGKGVEIWNAENSDRGKNAFGLLKFE